MSQLSRLSVSTTAIAAIVLLNPVAGFAAPPARQTVTRDKALHQSLNVLLAPARLTSIDFNRTDETITYVGLGDSSTTVFNLDAPLNSRKAKTVFLKRIQPLHFPGAKTASTTNLMIETIDRSASKRTYSFNIIPTTTKGTTRIEIVTAIAGEQTLIDKNGHLITLQQIETGLNTAIQRRYTPATDSIVAKTRQFLALARIQDISLSSLADQLKLKVAVLEALGSIGKRRIGLNN